MILLNEAAATPSVPTVILLGLGIVFFGLVCIIALVSLMGLIVRKTAKTQKTVTENSNAAVAKEINVNRGELVAAISAAIAEELGCDISRIRIHSIERL